MKKSGVSRYEIVASCRNEDDRIGLITLFVWVGHVGFRQKKHVAGVGLIVKSSNNVHQFLCSTCRWSSTESVLPDGGWPERCKEDEKKLSSFLENMQSLASIEKTDRERHKYTKRWLFILFASFYLFILT